MARRRIGQERLGFADAQGRQKSSLDEAATLVHWTEMDCVRRGLDRPLFEIITRQLDQRGLVMRTGRLVDPTLIQSASLQHDDEARWADHRRRKSTHGYKAHLATDQEAGLIRDVEVTTANIHDAAELDPVLPDAFGDTYGDTAFSGSRPEAINSRPRRQSARGDPMLAAYGRRNGRGG